MGMRKRIHTILPILFCAMTLPAMANWQYDGVYVGDGWYEDDGSRFILSFRGGAAAGFGTIKNDVGALSAYYYVDDAGAIIPETVCRANGGDCSGYELAGYGDISTLKPTKDFESFSFAAGASIGWTLPGRPQWRFEGGWDHIMKSDYNASPLFDGELQLYGGSVSAIETPSGAIQSTVETDVISAMAFYDFFDGLQKPLRTAIPYVGFGIGYSDTTTVLNLTDPYGDLSADLDLRNFGTVGDDVYEVVSFYKSEYSNSNIAGLLAAGFSYGLTETMFIDFGARMTYIPKIKWVLTNEDGSRHRDWISAENLIYLNVMLGLRFEF